MAKDQICRSFRQDFPEFVARAEALGVKISLSEGRRKGRDRVFWLNGYRQLTGYTTRSDDGRFTHDDAVRNIDKAKLRLDQFLSKLTPNQAVSNQVAANNPKSLAAYYGVS